jgi:uncharacterized protein (TIGR00255 family)
MPQSMTGFGAARREGGGFAVEVEVRTVNHRHLHVKPRVPPNWSEFEAEIEEAVRRRLERGTIYVNVSVAATSPGTTLRANAVLAERYVTLLRSLRRRLRLAGDVEIEDLVSLPGLFLDGTADPRARAQGLAAGKTALRLALEECVRRRAREGRLLAKDLAARARRIRGLVDRIERLRPAAVRRARERLRRRVEEALGKGAVEIREEDFARETALLADRTDVAEEITRLRAHVLEFGRILARPGAVGRTLDFLVQEMAREANTIGAKAADAGIARLVVDLKSELEKVREQAQNLE